jgi:CRP-like cAMP-binding protein
MAYSNNLMLGALAHSDMERLRPNLQSMKLTQGQVVMQERERVSHVYFPLNAVISLVVALPNNKVIESAMVGRDGIVAASPALDSRLSLTRAVVQIAGSALVCEAGVFRSAVLESPTLLSAMMRHEQTLYAQAQQSTACMSVHSVASRLCRFLLRARDLGEKMIFPLPRSCCPSCLVCSAQASATRRPRYRSPVPFNISVALSASSM